MSQVASGGTFVKNPGGPACVQPKSPEECCSHGGDLNWELTFCLMMCVFCCMECDVGNIVYSSITPKPITPENVIPRDYDVMNVVNGEIGFTTSEYGKFIPIVFGSDKLTGNVFWSSPFLTQQFTSGSSIYSYQTVSFALGICEGEIDAVLRIWLGERLIYDRTMAVDGDDIAQPGSDGYLLGFMVDLIADDSPLKSLADGKRLTKITVFNGGETQLAEGVIVDVEGISLTPGYRGLAYVLFENMVVTETIPNIYVEVLANSNPIFPRLYGDLPAPEQYFNRMTDNLIHYDPGYDRIVISAFDDVGAGGIIPGGRGFAVFDGNRLDHIYDREFLITEQLNSTSYLFTFWYMLSDGNWFIHNNASPHGVEFIYNPDSGSRVSVLGPGGDIFHNDVATGFGYLSGSASGVLYYPVIGVPMDIFYGVHYQGDVGFAVVRPSGKIDMVSNCTDALPAAGDFSLSSPVTYPETLTKNRPTFADGAATTGAHVYFFNYRGQSSDDLYVIRITIAGAASIYDPLVTPVAQISFNELSGAEYIYYLQSVIMDVDGCFVLFISCSRGDWIVKWSPFTNAFVWKTALTISLPEVIQSTGTSLLWGSTYSFIAGDDTIHTIDLSTGAIEHKGTLLSQFLPSTLGHLQFYNGFENSIVYAAESGDHQLVKVFLDRIARSNVPLSDIVSILLQRVGVLATEVNIEDLQALTLVGYTVSERKSLRSIFSELGQVFRFDILESNGKIVYRTRGAVSAVTIPSDHLGDVNEDGWLEQHQERDFVPARKLSLTYRDIDREYTTNVQTVTLPKYTNDRFDEDAAVEVNVPVVLNAEFAKTLAEILLYSKIVYQSTFDTLAAPEYVLIDPGDVVSIPLSNEKTLTARVRSANIGDDRQIQLALSQEDPDIYNDQAQLFGVVGRYNSPSLSALDPRIDPVFLPIPFRSDVEAALTTSNYRVYLTFLNNRIATPSDAVLTVTVNGEASSIPSPIHFPTWGRVITPPLARTSFFSSDNISTLRVKLISNSGPSLAPAASKLDLLNNGQMNLACVGSELIQFLDVTYEGDDVYLLTGLHRGMFGTEFGIFGHKGGEAFVLLAGANGVLDEISVIPISVPLGDSPLKVYQVFMNTNNPFQPNPITMFPALNLRPWAIADFVGKYVGDDAVMTWERRTRFDGQWEDDGDFEEVPLNELTETYDLYLHSNPSIFNMTDPATYLRKVTVTSPTYTYLAADQTMDGFNRLTTDLFVLINQNGSFTGKDSGAAIIRRVEYKR